MLFNLQHVIIDATRYEEHTKPLTFE